MVFGACAWFSACGPSGEPSADVAAAAAPTHLDVAAAAAPTRLDGAVRFNDVWLKVTPFVGHQGKMDLLNQCLTRRDDEVAAGKEPQPLCVERAKRASVAIKTLRVEVGFPSMRDAVVGLRDRNESAHVLVEKGGSIYQVLDFVYAPRREGEYRRDEVRFIAAGTEGAAVLEPLIEDMKRLYPGIDVVRVENK